MSEPALLRPAPRGRRPRPRRRVGRRRLRVRARVAARRHPAADDHARPDPGPPRRSRAAGAGRGGPPAVAPGARERWSRDHATCSPGSTPAPRSRSAAPSPSTSSSPTPPSSCTARASCAPCARRSTARCAMLMQRLAEDFPGEARAEVQAALETLELRPVFTAHPTESSRQSVLRVLRRVGDALDRGADDDEVAALVDLLWQTDEIRPGKPTVADEANAIGWYLEQLARNTVPELVGEFEREVRAAGFTVPDDSRPLVLGLVGRRRPRRQPVRHPAGHPRGRRAERGPRAAHPPAARRAAGRRAVDLDAGRRRLRGAARLAGPRPARAARGLRPLHPAQPNEPYRLKLSYVRARLEGTRARIRDGGAARRRARLPRRPGVHRGPAGDRPLAARAPRRPDRRRRAGPHAARGQGVRPAPGRARHPRAQRASTTPRSGRSTTPSASWTSPTPS